MSSELGVGHTRCAQRRADRAGEQRVRGLRDRRGRHAEHARHLERALLAEERRARRERLDHRRPRGAGTSASSPGSTKPEHAARPAASSPRRRPRARRAPRSSIRRGPATAPRPRRASTSIPRRARRAPSRPAHPARRGRSRAARCASASGASGSTSPAAKVVVIGHAHIMTLRSSRVRSLRSAARPGEALAAARPAPRRGAGRRDREGHAVRHPARRVPRRAARPAFVLERDRHEGAGRRDPARGPAARRARPAPAHARAPRDGHRARRPSSCTRPSRSCARRRRALLDAT